MLKRLKYVMALGCIGALLALRYYQQVARTKHALGDQIDLRIVVAYSLAFALSAYSFGLPEIASSRLAALARSLTSALLVVLLGSFVLTVFSKLAISRFLITAGPIGVVPWQMLCFEIARHCRRDSAIDSVLLVASIEEANELRSSMRLEPERPSRVVETISASDVKDNPARLKEAFEEADANLIVISRESQAIPEVLEAASLLHAQGFRVRSTTMFFDQWFGKLPVSEIASLRLFFDVRQLHDATYAHVKRVIDVAVGLVGCVVAAIAVPVVLLGNAVSNRGPMFFPQKRIGFGGQEFVVWKFRSMLASDEMNGTLRTQVGDTRVTPFGRFLRRSHFDELPQAWNIVRGDLSVVGPRPEQTQHVERLCSAVPHYGFRHLVRPGLTGWAQVKYPYGATDAESVEKLEYDLYYVRHQSLRLDVDIIFRTLRHLVLDGGR